MNIESVKRLPISTDDEAYHVLMAIRRHLCKWDGNVCFGSIMVRVGQCVAVSLTLGQRAFEQPFQVAGSDLRMCVMTLLRQIEDYLAIQSNMN